MPPDKRELRLLAQARDQLRRKGEVTPVLIVTGERSGVVGFKDFGPGEIARRAVRAAGRATAQYRPWRVSLLVDTWFKSQPGDLSHYQSGDLASDPEASEGIMLATQTREGEPRVVFQPYDAEDGKYVFEPPVVWEGGKVGAGALISEYWRGVGQGATGR